jgi:hypothetical protein
MDNDVEIFAFLVMYKVITLLVGFGFSYMGYRLFLADKTLPSGDLETRYGEYALNLRGGAPGIFFSLFGTILICASIFKGIEYQKSNGQGNSTENIVDILPDQPPINETPKIK